MKYVKGIFIFLGVLFAIAFTVGFISGLTGHNDYTATQESKDTSFRNAFVSSCNKDGTQASFCNCAYDKMTTMYPDFPTNESRMHRIVSSGYNSTETDAMVACIE